MKKNSKQGTKKATASQQPSTQNLQGIQRKKTIHEKYREVVVVQTDGTEFITRSTYSKHPKLILQIDIGTHPVWTKTSNYVNKRSSELMKFNDRFAALKFL